MPTIVIPPDPQTSLAAALRWAWRGDIEMCRRYLGDLSRQDLRAAHTTLLRVAAHIDTVLFQPKPEDVAAAVLQPDHPMLPDGVEGYDPSSHIRAVTP